MFSVYFSGQYSIMESLYDYLPTFLGLPAEIRNKIYETYFQIEPYLVDHLKYDIDRYEYEYKA
jgi:hypothetical protein